VGVDEQGTIQLVNTQTERLFGYTRDELLGRPIELLVPEAARSVHPVRRAIYAEDPQPRTMGREMEFAGRRKDGSEFPAEISLSAIDTEDGVLVSAAIRDVTDRIEAQAERERLRAEAQREHLESEMHQSQRLESLGQLAGGVAHDFNNLLGAILNYSMFVLEAVQKLPADNEENLLLINDVEQIQRAAERGTELTHQLLAFGRREVVRPQVLDLNDVVAGVQQFLRRTIGEHVELETKLSPDLLPVLADPGQLEQVFVNLAVNARDAMPSGGILAIDTTNVTVDDNYAAQHAGLSLGTHVRLRVSDNGVGIEREVREHIFEPFFTTKSRGEGSGLGLATVYGIVTQAGGSIHLYSKPGTGTTVTVLLPSTERATAIETIIAPTLDRGGGETILLVEDEAAMREVSRRILVRNGYEVLVAVNGPEAIQISANHRGDIDLLLTDVIMPHMLGREVAEFIVRSRPNTKVLFMSGYAQPVLASQGTLGRGVHLIEKPFTAEGLNQRIREVLGGDAR
jgi:hypothetical protein